jgi:hypothetical protein
LGVAQTNTALKTFSAGVKFATSGGTAATLNHYEDRFVHTTTVSGIWSAPQAISIGLTKIGSVVTFSYDDLYPTANTAATIALDAVLPTRFRPSVNISIPVFVKDASNTVMGDLYITTAGNMTWLVGVSSNFTGSGFGGIVHFSFSYQGT